MRHLLSVRIRRVAGYSGCVLAVLVLAVFPRPAHAAEPDITLAGSVPLAGHATGQVLSFDESARHLYVGTAEGVAVLDDKGSPLGLITVPEPRAIVLADPLRMGFIAGGGDNSVTIFDPANLKVVHSIATGLDRIEAMALDPRTSKLFVSSGRAIDIIDVASMTKKMDHLDLKGPVSAMAGDGAGRIFATLSDDAAIAVIDAKADTVRDNFTTGDDCAHPGTLLLDDIHKHLFVACEGSTMVVIDSDYGAIEASVTTDAPVRNLVFDSGLDRVFALTRTGDILTIGPGDHGYTMLAHAPDIGGAGLALNAGSHVLYTLHTNEDQPATLSILTRD